VRNVKTPKGTQDFNPEQMVIREKVFEVITRNFKKHGAVTIDTPAFELKETLMGKYGEDSKLIYDLQDQGGELCSLRYDLTVPFARYVAMNRIKSIRRYHIAKVYRRDNPAMNRGRFREFYQCDFDIAGNYDLMIPDAECVKLIADILAQVDVGPFRIKLNHRKILDGVFNICGVPEEKFRTICSAVDKLDKSPWDTVKKEMIEKGLSESVADKIWTFVSLKGKPLELVDELLATNKCSNSEIAVQALRELKTLFEYLQVYNVLSYIEFDMSLARGLDYYTGVIYEAVLVSTGDLGSIAAGGRYDGLVGIFGGEAIPAVGFSVGIERIFSILEKKAGKIKSSETLVLVVSKEKQGGLVKERMQIANLLWENNIPAEIVSKLDPKIRGQLDYASNNRTPFCIILDQAELEKGFVALKNMTTSTQIDIRKEFLLEDLMPHLDPFISPSTRWGSRVNTPIFSSSATSTTSTSQKKN